MLLLQPVTATPLAAALAQPPDPSQDRPSSLATRTLGFVRKLIDYGREHADTLPLQPPSGEAGIDLKIRFGILRFGRKTTLRILALIAHALRLAAILEDPARRPPRPPPHHRTALPARRRRTPPAPGTPRRHSRTTPSRAHPISPPDRLPPAPDLHRASASATATSCGRRWRYSSTNTATT